MQDTNGKELFNAAEQGNIEMCSKLLQIGAQVDWKAGSEYWFRTPLMQAAKGGHTEVCQLFLDHKAQVNAFTLNHWTALMLAARYGHSKTCQLLIARGADINNETLDNKETALMWAASNNHYEVCKLLVEKGANPNAQDNQGITALMRAAKDNQLEACRLLLESGAQTNLIAKLGNQVIDAESWAKTNGHQRIERLIKSFRINRSLASEGTEPPSFVTMNVCGAENAGKTTLLENLQKGFFKRRRSTKEQLNTYEDMAARTAGIEVGIIDIPGVGKLRKMDMAGHSWAFTINDFFLGKQTSISLVLFDITKSDEQINAELIYHLGLLKAKESRKLLTHRPEVILVATHCDKCSHAEVRAKKFYLSMRDEYQAYLNLHANVMVLNCCDPDAFGTLKEALKELHKKIITRCETVFIKTYYDQISDRVPKLCSQLIPHIRSWAKEKSSYPVMQWEEFLSRVKQVNPAVTSELLRNVVYYLAEIREIINDDSLELKDKVILDVNWLTHDVLGIALAPANFPLTLRSDRVYGLVPRDEIRRTFPQCPVEQLLDIFLRFEICLPFDESVSRDADTFLFPSHLETRFEKLDHVWPQHDGQDEMCVVGRIVECKTLTDMFPSSFFPRIQMRLLKLFGHRSPVWLGGIKLVDGVIEILVTQSEDLRSISICVWAPKGCEERCYKALLYVESIRDRLMEEICTGTETNLKVLSIRMLRHMKFVGYPIEDVKAVLSLDGIAAYVALQEFGVKDKALDILYCGLRKLTYPADHVSHLTIGQRRRLSTLLDSGYGDEQLFSRLSSELGIDSALLLRENSGLTVFNSLIPGSYSDRLLAAWGEGYSHSQNELARVLRSIGFNQAASVIFPSGVPSENSESRVDDHEINSDQMVASCQCVLPVEETKTESSCTAHGTYGNHHLRYPIEESGKPTSGSISNESMLPLPKEETGDAAKDVQSSCPGNPFDVSLLQVLPEMAERLGLSWIDLAREFGFSEHEILEFKTEGLLQRQALHMLRTWYTRRTLDCKTCNHCLEFELRNGLQCVYREELVKMLPAS